MKVLQICHDYEGPFRNVCRQYAIAFKGHDVTTVYLKGPPNGAISSALGCKVVYFDQGKMSGFKFSALTQMLNLLRQNQFDVVVAHRYKAIYLAGMMSYLFKLPTILAVAHEHNVFNRLSRKLFITFWRKKIVVAGVSDSVTQNIESACATLSTQNRLFCLPNAVDMSLSAGLLPRKLARQSLGLAADGFVFGIIGRLVHKKNHDVLLRAFMKLEVSAKLIIVGDGPLLGTLVDRVKELGIGDRVIFAGFNPEASRLVSAFDMFVMSSGDQEAFGIVLLEAMLGKISVLCSDTPGPRSVLADTAMYFENDNSDDLTRQLTNAVNMSQSERDELGEQGYQRLEQEFSYTQFKRRLSQIPGLEFLS